MRGSFLSLKEQMTYVGLSLLRKPDSRTLCFLRDLRARYSLLFSANQRLFTGLATSG
jgi:hypothetical protein